MTLLHPQIGFSYNLSWYCFLNILMWTGPLRSCSANLTKGRIVKVPHMQVMNGGLATRGRSLAWSKRSWQGNDLIKMSFYSFPCQL